MSFGDDDEGTPIIPRQDALEKFIYKYWRGFSAKRGIDMDEQQAKLRDFAGSALYELIHSPKHLRQAGRLIAEGIEVLCGKEYFSAKEIFDPTGALLSTTSRPGVKYQKRMFIKDEDWKSVEDDRTNPRYVVVHD